MNVTLEKTSEVVTESRKTASSYRKTLSSLNELKVLLERLKEDPLVIDYQKLEKISQKIDKFLSKKLLTLKLKFPLAYGIPVFTIDLGNGPLTYYLAFCSNCKHYFVSYPQGLKEELRCPECDEEFFQRYGVKKKNSHEF